MKARLPQPASENLSLCLVLLLFGFPQNSEHTLFWHSEPAVARLAFPTDVFLVFPRVADVLIRLDHSLQPLFVELVDVVCCVLDFPVSSI